LWGKVASRLAVVLSILFGGLPVLALVLTFGGVSMMEMLNATINTAVVAIVVGALGAFFGLFSRSVVVPMALALLYVVPSMLILPGVYTLIAGGDPAHHPGQLSPLFALSSQHWTGLLPALAYLPVVVSVASVSVPVFRVTLTRSASSGDMGAGSPQWWALESFRRRTWTIAAALVVVGAAWFAFWTVVPVPQALLAARTPMTWLGMLLVLTVGTHIYLITFMYLLQASQEALTDPTGGLLTRQTEDHPDAEESSDGLVDRLLWREPLLWREVRTGAYMGARLAAVLMSAGMVTLLALGWWANGFDDPATNATLSLVAVVGACVSTGVLATASLADERSARTFPLLLLSPLGAPRILATKMLGALVRSLPLLIIALLLRGLGASPEVSPVEMADMGLHLWVGSSWLQVLWIGLWSLAAMTALGLACMNMALWIDPPELAWPASVTVVAAWFALPMLGAVGPPGLDTLSTLWVPMFDGGFGPPPSGTPAILVVSAALMGALISILGSLAMVQLNAYSRRHRY